MFLEPLDAEVDIADANSCAYVRLLNFNNWIVTPLITAALRMSVTIRLLVAMPLMLLRQGGALSNMNMWNLTIMNFIPTWFSIVASSVVIVPRGNL